MNNETQHFGYIDERGEFYAICPICGGWTFSGGRGDPRKEINKCDVCGFEIQNEDEH